VTVGREKLFILHVFDGFRVGGTEVRTCHILNALHADFRHAVVACNGDFSARSLINPDVEVSFHHPDFMRGPRLKQLLSIATYLKKMSPDLMIAYEWGAIDWVMANSFTPVCPMIMAVEGFEEEELREQKKTRLLLRRLFYPRCSRIVACSKVLCDLAITSWKIRDAGKIMHIPNGINCSNFQPAERSENHLIQAVTLGAVGSLIKLKNHAKLLHSFKRLVDRIPARLIIVGDGPERVRLEQLCSELDIVNLVEFTGQVKNPADKLRKMDIFCLASDTEQMPMVVLEAMATGLPIVSTDVGDVREMVARENRPFVVPRDNEDGYVNALIHLAGSQAERESVGQANLLRVRRYYDERLMFSRYRELYQATAIRKVTSTA